MNRLRLWGPAVAWAVAIWWFSTEGFSAGQTSRFLLPLLQWLLPGTTLQTLLQVHFWIRKAAHVAEYFVFSLLLLRGVRGESSERREWRLSWGLAAIAVALCYAALDEVHQAFVPGRGASALDVARDVSGAALAQVWAWWRARKGLPRSGEQDKNVADS